MKAVSALKEFHRAQRIAWAKEHLSWRQCDWSKVVFSAEKKFNPDGPDGFSYYWHDLRKKERIFSALQGGNE